MTNTIATYRHAALAMPAAGRVRVPSLRALSMSDCVLTGQKWVVDAPVRGTAIVPAADVTTGAFPGTHAWSPPS